MRSSSLGHAAGAWRCAFTGSLAGWAGRAARSARSSAQAGRRARARARARAARVLVGTSSARGTRTRGEAGRPPESPKLHNWASRPPLYASDSQGFHTPSTRLPRAFHEHARALSTRCAEHARARARARAREGAGLVRSPCDTSTLRPRARARECSLVLVSTRAGSSQSTRRTWRAGGRQVEGRWKVHDRPMSERACSRSSYVLAQHVLGLCAHVLGGIGGPHRTACLRRFRSTEWILVGAGSYDSPPPAPALPTISITRPSPPASSPAPPISATAASSCATTRRRITITP